MVPDAVRLERRMVDVQERQRGEGIGENNVWRSRSGTRRVETEAVRESQDPCDGGV